MSGSFHRKSVGPFRCLRKYIRDLRSLSGKITWLNIRAAASLQGLSLRLKSVIAFGRETAIATTDKNSYWNE
jgi:hypothetical protein